MTLFDFLRSKRLYSTLTILVLILFINKIPVIAFSAILLITMITYRYAFLPLRHYHFWVMISILLILVPLFTGNQTHRFFFISYSYEQLILVFKMTLRGISVFLLFQVMTLNINPEKLSDLMVKLGIKHFESVKALSSKSLPKIKSILKAHYGNYRKIWNEKKSFRSLFNFIADIFWDLLLFAEETEKQALPTGFYENDIISKYHKTEKTIIVLTGRPGSGKTPRLTKLAKALQDAHHKVDGLLSQKIQQSNDDWYHNLIRISTHESKQLNTMLMTPSPIQIGKFYFYPQTFAWANQQLIDCGDAEWLILDEVGILEFNGGGFLPGMQNLFRGYSNKIIFSIRPGLKNNFPNFIEKYIPELSEFNIHYYDL